MESTSLQTTKQSMPFFSLFYFTGHHQGIGHHLRDPFCRAPMSNEIKPVMIPTGSHRAWPGLRWNFQLPPSIPPIGVPSLALQENTTSCDLQLLHVVHATTPLPFETQNWVRPLVLCCLGKDGSVWWIKPQFSLGRIAKVTDTAASPLFSIYGTDNMTLSFLHNQAIYALVAL